MPALGQTGAVSSLDSFSADGYRAAWSTWDGVHEEEFSLRWENEGWTASGQVGREGVHYVLRLTPTWQARQFLLFRDLDEPDLWLAQDASHRWGEMNGAYRPDLDGAADIELSATPFTPSVPIRRLGLHQLAIDEAAEVKAIEIDVETLGVVIRVARYERVSQSAWRRVTDESVREFEVDDHGLVVTEQGRFRRTS